MLKYLKQLAGESAIYGISAMLTRFITIFLVPIYTKVFSPSSYGEMSVINTTFALLAILVVLGLDSASGFYFYEAKEIEDKKLPIANWFWAQLGFSAIIFIGISIFSKSISILFFGSSNNSFIFIIAALNLLLTVFPAILINWLRYHRKAVSTAVLTFCFSILTIIFNIIFIVYLRLGIIGPFYSALCSSIVFSIICIFLLKDWIHPRHVSAKLLAQMFQFSLPLIPAGIAYWVTNSSASYFLNFNLSKEEVGLFQIGSSIASGILLFIGAFQMAIGPFALSISQHENARLVYSNIFLGYTIVTSFLFLGLSSFSYEILVLLTDDAYYNSKTVASIIALNFIFLGLNYIGSIGLNLAKDNKPYMYAVLIAAGVNVLLFFVFIPIWGKEGAALAMTLSTFFSSCYIFYASQKRYLIPYPFKLSAAILAFSIILAAFLNTLYAENILLLIFIKGFCLTAYVLVMFLCVKRYILKKPLLPLLKVS